MVTTGKILLSDVKNTIAQFKLLSVLIKEMTYILGLIFMVQPIKHIGLAKYGPPEVINTSQTEWPFNDKNLTKERIKKLIVHYWPDRKNIIEIQIFKTAGNDDWVIQYSKNIPQFKFTNRKIAYLFKKDTTYYKVENLVFYRDYLGGSQYGEIHTSYLEDIKTIVNNCIYKP